MGEPSSTHDWILPVPGARWLITTIERIDGPPRMAMADATEQGMQLSIHSMSGLESAEDCDYTPYNHIICYDEGGELAAAVRATTPMSQVIEVHRSGNDEQDRHAILKALRDTPRCC